MDHVRHSPPTLSYPLKYPPHSIILNPFPILTLVYPVFSSEAFTGELLQVDPVSGLLHLPGTQRILPVIMPLAFWKVSTLD